VPKEKVTVARPRILLAEDYAVMRERTVRLLETEFEVVGVVGNGHALLEAAVELHPDVCVVDISMPVLNGIDAAAQLKERGSRAKVVFLTVHDDDDFVQAAIATGALGYVLKSRMASDLCHAVNDALAGELFVSSSLTSVPNA
jgi:DNA-binding NarL/FixJ family response regulator